MNNDWLAVFEALKAVYSDGAYSNISINEAVSRHKGLRESFVRSFAKGVLRSSIRLDHVIDSLAGKGIKSIKPRPLIILRMGIYAVDELDSVPDHAAVNEAVELAKAVAKGNDRFVNGMLRNYLRRKADFAPDKLEPHIRYAISKDVFSLLSDQYGDEAIRIAEALNEPSEVYLRVNTLKADRDVIIKKLADFGIESRPAEENSEAIHAIGSGIVSCELYKEGFYTIQSISSMIAVKALSPLPGSRVLDLCAAPGGKTGYMAELMGNEGSITACDVHRHRLMLTQAAMKRLGVSICEVRERDAAVYDPSMNESFDYVLADVPCSGLGVIASKPEIKLTADPARYDGLIAIQKSILENAVRYLKPGGRLEYSTCTLNKNENEEVVKHVLSKEGTSIRVIEMATLMPYNGKVGFYYCIIEKNAI
ncbi:MAG: 16S rRNA (cytosine(967)-C(5))-methyltransferase RsmB [Mogibacterium sp.]|nr:16S rRNA (cytosine(967)-C(5))-methyltransferase RsmB [Mogibacterium sp.]MBR0341603.1 16S rRNA (cytosine(967)-C(5))-methyltransferase RsmB [Oscillospiraceae bacterium]